VFNMGHRMEIYLPEAFAKDVVAISESFGIPAQIVGYVETGGKGLTVKSEYGIFEYS